MKGVMFMASQRVSNIGRIVDTLVLGGVVIATGLFQNGALLRWLICLILSISILEIATTIIERIFQRRGIYHIKQPLVGIIDFLAYTKTEAIILDYKFSSSKKTQDDFDMNSQLPL